MDWPRTDRECPKCRTVFSSVQSLGCCPTCGYTFRIGAEGRRDGIFRFISNLVSLVLMILLPVILVTAVWLLCRPFYYLYLAFSHQITWDEFFQYVRWLDIVFYAVFFLLVLSGPIPQGLRRYIVRRSPTEK